MPGVQGPLHQCLQGMIMRPICTEINAKDVNGIINQSVQGTMYQYVRAECANVHRA